MTPPRQYRKRPVVVEAVRYTGDSLDEIAELAGGHLQVEEAQLPGPGRSLRKGLRIHTLEGDMVADVGDWIIRGVAGELYPCKPDIFDRTYEEVSPRH